ncbi:MAG: hypothetical protein GY759_10580 [Chloroflexi bacterium]|nr:hypothetical protein [Chloroflexota bacterium]
MFGFVINVQILHEVLLFFLIQLLTCFLLLLNHAHDLFHIERASYAQLTQENTVVCENAIEIRGGEWLWKNVKNPWHDFFIDGYDQEYRKVAVATMREESDFEARCYGLAISVGLGAIIFSQVKLLDDNDKLKRVYTRLLSNLGAEIQTLLLSYTKDEKDYGIASVMALPYRDYQDYDKMESYFIAPDFILNNLGEGAYGWMKPLHKKAGWITVPDSTGQTYFLTLFVESEINRDPSRRTTGVLPDPSIVPDLAVGINCSFKLFVNGKCHIDYRDSSSECVDKPIEDVVLSQGTNRLVFVCQAGAEDIRLNVCFKNKFGNYMDDLRYFLTMD